MGWTGFVAAMIANPLRVLRLDLPDGFKQLAQIVVTLCEQLPAALPNLVDERIGVRLI